MVEMKTTEQKTKQQQQQNKNTSLLCINKKLPCLQNLIFFFNVLLFKDKYFQ